MRSTKFPLDPSNGCPRDSRSPPSASPSATTGLPAGSICTCTPSTATGSTRRRRFWNWRGEVGWPASRSLTMTRCRARGGDGPGGDIVQGRSSRGCRNHRQFHDRELHLLGYFVRLDNENLLSATARLRAARRDVLKMVKTPRRWRRHRPGSCPTTGTRRQDAGTLPTCSSGEPGRFRA